MINPEVEDGFLEEILQLNPKVSVEEHTLCSEIYMEIQKYNLHNLM